MFSMKKTVLLNRLINKYYLLILISSVILFLFYFTYLSFLRHDNYYSRRLDLGNMDQTVWNVLHGNGFTLTDPTGSAIISRLAIHADFLLIFLAPFYLIWSDPKMLLLIQTVVVVSGAFPVFAITNNKLKSKILGLLFALSYLLYPSINKNLLHDFHAVFLSTPLLLYSYWFLTKNNFFLFFLFAFFAATGKEDVWLVTAFLGLEAFFAKRKKALGLIIIFFSLLIFYALFWIFIPQVTVNQQHWALTYFSDFGSSQNEIIKYFLIKPFDLVGKFMSINSLYYYFQLFLPLGFLSFFAPKYLIYALPALTVNILSNNPMMRKIDYQYTSTIIPWLFISAISGFSFLQKTLPKIIPRIFSRKKTTFFAGFLLTVFMILTSYLWGELPFTRETRLNYFRYIPVEKNTIDSLKKEIKPFHTVSATNNIAAHFSQRQFLFNYPIKYNSSDYVLIQLDDPYAWPSDQEQKRVLKELQNSQDYVMIAQLNTFYAFRRKQ